jgi:capsular exopolysaccharide synthesis family protein
LLQRYKEVGIAGGVGTNNISIVDAALVPLEPSSPRLLSNLMLALLLGMALSAGVVFILEQIDEAITDPSDVQRVVNLPLLGTIPQPEDNNRDIADLLLDRKSPISEAYLSAQTNLQFSTDHGFPRSISITSTRAGEGKSTTAFALAQLLARMGKRVVLVDGDMRSPSVGAVLGLSNSSGLSNYLAGDDNLSAMLLPVEGLQMHAMLAGPPPPSAAELLTGPRLEQLIKTLLQSFDHVIIDSPPVLGLADAPLIARRVEGVVYTIESRGATSRSIRAAIERLRAASAPILGVVLSKFDASKLTYGYGYEYGYGYGQGEAKSA